MGDDGILLRVEAIAAGYGKRQVLDGVSIDVNPGEIVAVVGRNGAGKSTLLKAIYGVVPIVRGYVTYKGQRVVPAPEWTRQASIAFQPQGKSAFDELTVRENLQVAACKLDSRTRQSRIAEAQRLWPVLKGRWRRKAGTLSGGEGQMLGLAMVWMTGRDLLLLDEPSLGVSPKLTRKLLEEVETLAHQFGVAVVIVEQRVLDVLRIASRVVVLRDGKVSYAGQAQELLANYDRLRTAYF